MQHLRRQTQSTLPPKAKSTRMPRPHSPRLAACIVSLRATSLSASITARVGILLPSLQVGSRRTPARNFWWQRPRNSALTKPLQNDTRRAQLAV